MVQDNENVTENETNIKTINENVYKRYRITMEFPIFFSMLAIYLSAAPVSNLILYRTCVHSLNHTQEECQDFLSPIKKNRTHDLEEEVQKYATNVVTVRTIIESVTPAILALFIGVWSDRHGRKPLVVWSLFGMTVSGGLIVVYSILDNLGPWWLILTSVPLSLSGGIIVMFTGSFCYVSDISTKDKRSLRMTLLQASMSAGNVIGAVLSSYLLIAVGYVYLLLIAASLYAIAFLFTTITTITLFINWMTLLQASMSAGNVIGAVLSSYLLIAVGYVYLLLIAASLYAIAFLFTTLCLKESLTGAVKGRFLSVLDFKSIKKMLVTCFKERPNHGRAQVLLLALVNCLTASVLFGQIGVQYWYRRQKLQWSIQEYTIYSAVHTAISFTGSIVGVMIIQKLLNVSDLAFAVISLMSAATDYTIIAFATLSWHMYLGGGISLFQTLSVPLIRSLLTKILPSEDIAKVFTLVSALEGIGPLISSVLYNSLYASTLSNLPGAVYLLSTGICILCMVLLGFVQYYRWKESLRTSDVLTKEL